MQSRPQRNPFPGLRPYEPDEDHLFFGREKEVDDLLRRLRFDRFLPVVGTSGCGKSSLVRSGLIPALHSGMMVKAGSSWRIAMMRPGEDPIGHLAEALDSSRTLGVAPDELASTNRVLIDATLRRGSLGLAAAVRQARMPADDNVLVLIDQFEELFRFRRSRQIENSRDEAVAFVRLLLEAAAQSNLPIYIVLTMRSDFIGDCIDYPGLPEAINASHYLVPRMTRDELRSVITGPIAVAGATIAPRLVVRVLNDLGDRQDELPILQHALMRTWDHWEKHRPADEPIDVESYESIGTLAHALSLHAEEAYAEATASHEERLTELIFKALTDTVSDPRGIRRPTSVGELAAIAGASESEVIRVVDLFRREGRSFLMPPPSVRLSSDAIVDISHESLMRTWDRLIRWAEEERTSAELYRRLAQEAHYFEEGKAALWGDPELELGLRWRRDNRPTEAWARRYDPAFDRAMAFLEESEVERDRLKAERRRTRVRNLMFAWGTAAVLLVAFMIALWQGLQARRERQRAETNLRLATTAVDELLAATERDQSGVGGDVPQMEQFRRELLERAKTFYTTFISQQPNNPQFKMEMAAAHVRLGHIYRLLDDNRAARNEYRSAVVLFEELVRLEGGNEAYRSALGDAYNWLGEALRLDADNYTEAEQAYGMAANIQTALVDARPDRPEFRQALARTRYNRGILYANAPQSAGSQTTRAESDFRQAITLLEGVERETSQPSAAQELARAYNNLAALVSQDPARLDDARPLYEKAIRTDEQLTAANPANREYVFELAKFRNNYAELLRQSGEVSDAARNNADAIAELDGLARPAGSLAVEQADAHSLRGRILEAQSASAAAAEYERAFQLFKETAERSDGGRLPVFHMRFTDLLFDLVSLQRSQAVPPGSHQLLTEAFSYYANLGVSAARAGHANEAREVLANLTMVRGDLTPGDAAATATAFGALQQAAGSR
jgi:tetratricopeptide (TPR) repeat protein